MAPVEVEGAPVDATVKGAPAEAEAMVKEVSPTLREAGTKAGQPGVGVIEEKGIAETGWGSSKSRLVGSLRRQPGGGMYHLLLPSESTS